MTGGCGTSLEELQGVTFCQEGSMESLIYRLTVAVLTDKNILKPGLSSDRDCQTADLV